MSVYRVHCMWKKKEVIFKARSLDLTHPYFVSIKDLVFTPSKSLIINPNDDEIRKEFGDTDHLMIPFQSVSMIEEINDKTWEKSSSITLYKDETDKTPDRS